MDISSLLELLKRVLLTPEVIGVTVFMIVFFSLVNFVVYYRKKPPVPKPKKTAPAPAPASAENTAKPGDEDEEAEEGAAEAKKKKGGKRGKKADKGAKEAEEEESKILDGLVKE